MSTTDTTEIKTRVHGMWSKVADRWAEHADYVDARSAGLSERMLDAAQLQPRDRVLELACGAGGLGIAAAERLGDSGHVVLSDVSPEMVAHAATRARALGLSNIEARSLDLEQIDTADASFDAVLCREGMMFATDPARAAAEMHRVLRPGGRLAVAVWGPPTENPWLTFVFEAVSEVTGMAVPPPGIPGPFSLSDADALRDHLVVAGFADVVVSPVAVPVRAGSFDEWWGRTRQIAGPLALILANLDAATRAAIERRLRAKAAPYQTAEMIELPGVALLATARRAQI
jgi:ubiquinone/menaquinone biosynthesis C-methylase UbiE